MAIVKDPYVNALFKISEERNTLEEDLKQIIFINECLSGTDVQAFIEHPNISDAEKYKLIDNAFSEKVNEHILGFLHLMIRRHRESYILNALGQYIELVNRYFGKIEARLVSAEALLPRQIESISDVLSRKTDMEVKVNTVIDPDVISGFYILLDGRIFDNTIRSKLNSMKKQFYKGKVLARVVSAKALDDNQVQAISQLISRKLNTQVSVNVVVDTDLIGGFYVVVDGHVYDGTVRSDLKDKKKDLKKGKIEW